MRQLHVLVKFIYQGQDVVLQKMLLEEKNRWHLATIFNTLNSYVLNQTAKSAVSHILCVEIDHDNILMNTLINSIGSKTLCVEAKKI